MKALPSVLDCKLGDYVFFPLSHLFRQAAKLPTRVITLTLKCLYVLISSGWCRSADKELRRQIIILLGYLAGGSPTEAKSRLFDEDVILSALHCLKGFHEQQEDFPGAATQSVDADTLLALGHTVTVILGRLKDGPSGTLKIAAAEALYAFISSTTDRNTLCRFLPGITSSISKVLQSRSSSREPYKALEISLRSLSLLFRRTLASNLGSRTPEHEVMGGQQFGNEWIHATSGQIKIALASILQLRYHEHAEVVDAMFDLSIAILRDSREALAITTTMMLETALIICSDRSSETFWSKMKVLHDLIGSDMKLLGTLQLVLHDWVTSLPRLMQSNNTVNQRRQINQISAAYRIAGGLSSNTAVLDHEIGEKLRESVGAAVRLSDTPAKSSVQEDTDTNFDLIHITQGTVPALKFEPLPILGSSQKESLNEMERLIRDIDTLSASAFLRRNLIESLQSTSISDHLACLWLASRLVTATEDLPKFFETNMNYLQDMINTNDQLGEIVYSHCVKLLSSSVSDDGGDDWRLQAIALEVIASRSSYAGQDFRPELVDTLYPVLQCLGSNNKILQRHAMTCLNILAKTCGYNTTSDLLIQNVDYLVNSVALRLNAFDLRPQGPQVLLMMIRICGPTLIPYLDDLIESVFSALASFHGYPRLVKLLFMVLETLVDEGSKDAKWITSDEARRSITLLPSSSIPEVALLLQKMSPHSDVNSFREVNIEGFGALDAKDVDTDFVDSGLDDQRALSVSSSEESKVVGKTYSMVQSVVQVGQYYLTHDSPAIRRQILNLTSRSCKALYRDENKFLPLINEVWPLIVKRLYDSQPYVSVAAAQTIGSIIRYAGDFMSSRINDEWPNIQALYWQVHARKVLEQQGRHSAGHFTSAYQICDALVALCCQVVENVRITADAEDDLIDMLSPYALSRHDVRMALECLNPDALWLALQARTLVDSDIPKLTLPQLEGYSFLRLH